MAGLPTENWDCQNAYLIVTEYCPATIPYGMNIRVHFGSGYATEVEAREGLDAGISAMTINGQSVPVSRFGPYFVDHPGNPHYAYGTDHEWGTPTPGNYALEVFEQGGTRTCEVTILEPPQ
jgi:hypothetical protein